MKKFLLSWIMFWAVVLVGVLFGCTERILTPEDPVFRDTTYQIKICSEKVYLDTVYKDTIYDTIRVILYSGYGKRADP